MGVYQVPDETSITNDDEAENQLKTVANTIWEQANEPLKEVAEKINSVLRKIILSWQNTDSPDFKNNPEASNRLYEWWNASEYKTKTTGRPITTKLAEIMCVKDSTARGYVKDNFEERTTPTIWAAENLKAFLLENTGSQETYYDIIHGKGAYNKAEEYKRKKPYIDSLLFLINEDSLAKLNERDLEILTNQVRAFF